MRSGPGGKRARKAPPGGVRAEKGRSPTYVGAAGVALVATVFFAAMRGRLTAPPSALDSPPSRPVPAREARGPRVRHERAAEAGVAEAGPAEAAEQCVDLSEHCAYWAANGECASNPPYMLAECAASCGACAGARARADGASDEEDEVLRERRRAWPKCKDKAAECPLWARAGECAKNERYMMVQCALSCASCEMQDFATRCKRDPNATPAVLPGQMDEMFARIETSPEYARYAPRVVSRDPWIVVLDEFMSADEADEIVRVAMRDEGVHFTASQGTSGIDEDGTLIPTVSSYRTSHTNWCEDECIDQPAVAAVRQRVVSITGVPDVNHEFPQILRYTHSQYYNEHHDFIGEHSAMPCGPRVYTMFLYLSDVEEGGHTRFTQLNISVQPKRGRAVLWPSTLSAAPMEQDVRTHHVAEPVVRGVKYSVNLWLHMFDFKSANKISCTG